MSNRFLASVTAMIVVILVTGCASTEPATTSLPPTATQTAREATNTPPPPIATPAPPTVTAVPPTPTSKPLPPPAATSLPPTAAPSATPMPAPLLSFKFSPQLFGRTETFQVRLGDLDGDGDLDAVLANMGANDSQVWFNDGAGQFVDSGQALTRQGHGVDLGDLDGDGDLDAFITCAHFGAGGRSKQPSRVYLNDGRGTLEDSGQDLGDTELSGNGVNLIDLDGDGDLDAHVIYYEVDGMADKVYLNDGAGRFSDSGLALTEEEIAWGDLDADGDVDIFAKAYGQGYRVLLNDGTGRFATGWREEDSQAIYGHLALADLDGDGDLDVLIASGFRTEGSYPTRLLWNDGTGQFADSGQELNETMAARFAVGDLDRDGFLDVLVSNSDQRPGEAWLNDGTGRLVDSGLLLESPSRHMATWPSLGDLDGDGDLDIIESGFQGRAEVWLNNTPWRPTGVAPTSAVTQLAGLPIDQFLEQSFRQLQLRDPDILYSGGFAGFYGVELGPRFTDLSAGYVRATQQLEREILDLLHTYDRSTLSPDQKISYDALEWYLDIQVRGQAFTGYKFLVNPVWGLQNLPVEFLLEHPLQTRHDAENYLARISNLGTWADQVIEGLELNEQVGAIPPKFVIQTTINGLDDILQVRGTAPPAADEIEVYTNFRTKLRRIADLTSEERTALLDSALREVEASFIPAYQAIRDRLVYLATIAVADPDEWSLPGGDDYYAYLLEYYTGTDLTADEIHALGLAEVDRIQAELRDAAVDLDYPAGISMAELNRRIDEDSRVVTGEALRRKYEGILTAAVEAAGEYFDLQASADVVVRSVSSGPPAYYDSPEPGSSDPGMMPANLAISPLYMNYNEHVLVHHETVPGHHTQLALAQELDLPPYQRLSSVNPFLQNYQLQAYVEGWALYAEVLAWEMGLYDGEALANLGRLRLRLIRTARVVVDTGIHAKGWTLEQAASYLEEITGMSQTNAGLVRYLVNPGYACGYNVGGLKMLEMRQRAMDQLGDRFDIKEFHNAILGHGILPIAVLEHVVDNWIDGEPYGAATITSTPVAHAECPGLIPESTKVQVRQRVDGGLNTGIVVGIVAPCGRDLYAYGQTALSGSQPVDGDTVFELGSVGKAFTAVLLADMVRRGEVSLDDPIEGLLPVTVTAPVRNGRSITLIDLATHTSGLPGIPDNLAPADMLNPYADYTVEQMYDALARTNLMRDSGSRYEYSNFGMGLLGHLLSLQTGMSYEELVVARICDELDMPYTRITLTPNMQSRLATGYREGEPFPLWDNPTLAGAGALRSTVQDMLNFLAANLGLQESSLYEAMQLTHQPRYPVAESMEVGLAWHIRTRGDLHIVEHHGATGGYWSFAGFVPEEQIGVVVLTNTYYDVDAIGLDLLQSAATPQP